MTAAITRKLEFDYGHRVVGHEGKCKNLHGHRGVVELTVTARKLDDLGRVVDFSILKTVVGGWIDTNLDHRMILNPDDPQLPHLLRTEPESSIFLMPPWANGLGQNPTAENLAALIYFTACTLLADHLKVVRVRFFETPNSWADYPAPG